METVNGNKNGAPPHACRYVFDGFEIDTANRILLRDGESVPLTGKAFDILTAFAENPGRLLSKDELIEKVWQVGFVEEGNLARNVSTLRKALGDTGRDHKYIVTVQGRGYRFVADVVRAEATAEEPSDASFRNPTAIPPVSRRVKVAGHLYRRPLLFSIAGLCLVGIAVIAFRFEGYRSLKKVLSFERQRQARLTQDGNVYEPVISPDGQYLAYVKISGNERTLCVKQIATGSTLELQTPELHTSYWALTFAPDNSFLYYIRRERGADFGNLYRIPLLGGQPHKLTSYANGGLTVAPDGKRIAFLRIDRQAGTSAIVVVDHEGGNEQVVSSTHLDSMFYSLDWAPDGNSFLYSFKTSEGGREYWYLAEIPAAGGMEQRIGELSESPISAARWMPDKSGLVVNAVDEATRQPQIYAVSYPDGTRHRITNDLNSYMGFSMTADGRSIVLPMMNSSRQIWDVSEGRPEQAVQISGGTEKHFESIAWSRNEFLVFDEDGGSSFDKYNIYRARMDGSDLQQLTDEAGSNTDPTVSPDGETIVFISNRTGKRQLWKMSIDGRDVSQLTDLTNDVLRPVFSPDGQTIFFSVSVAGKCQIWRVPAGGGMPSPVIDADVYRWTVSPDGKHLAYSTFDRDAFMVRTRIHSLQVDQPDLVLDISPETWMEWSNDGKSIYYNVADDGSQNIWRQPLDGSKPHPATVFNGEQVFRFAWSPDGKNLACIRHTSTFDAVILRFD